LQTVWQSSLLKHRR